MDNVKLSPGDIVILVAGAVVLIFGFLPFYEFSGFGGSVSASAWSTEAGTALFPLATLVVIFGVAMAVVVALDAFANVDLPDRVLGFTWNQVHLALGFQATILMLAYLIRSKGGLDFGIGFWFLLLGSIALLVGAILRMQQAGSTTPPPPPPPPPL